MIYLIIAVLHIIIWILFYLKYKKSGDNENSFFKFKEPVNTYIKTLDTSDPEIAKTQTISYIKSELGKIGYYNKFGGLPILITLSTLIIPLFWPIFIIFIYAKVQFDNDLKKALTEWGISEYEIK